MLGEKHDLADVISVMHELAIDRLHYGVLFAADIHLLLQIIDLQRVERVKHALPATFPKSAYVVFRRFGDDNKFIVAVAIRFLTVSGEEIGPARDRITGYVLHDHGDAV